MNLNRCFLNSYISADLKGPKVKYKLHYGRCTWPLFRDATQHKFKKIMGRTDFSDQFRKIIIPSQTYWL